MTPQVMLPQLVVIVNGIVRIVDVQVVVRPWNQSFQSPVSVLFFKFFDSSPCIKTTLKN
tara:strand:+ start:392 stop:568 length:177 start_codon:yes stop_codon:yes gene_type:complete